MAFEFTEDHLRDLFQAANLPPVGEEMTLFGLRGCSPVDETGTGFSASQKLEFIGVDYIHMRCTIGQWAPGRGLAVFPGSTVPFIDFVRAAVPRGGTGVNQLCFGCFTGDHKYYKGDHKISNPNTRHRAFRNDSMLPVWRTGDDPDYEGDDLLDYQTVYDNIHCAWQMNVEASSYSSDGCQVIAGRPRVLARGWDEELGPWAKFVKNAYDLPQTRFPYALFSGREALKVAEIGSYGRPQTVRFGSVGPLVREVQEALIHHGFDIGETSANGECNFRTINAVRLFQLQKFGPPGTDLIVGELTGKELGITWPNFGERAPVFAPVAPPSNEGGASVTVAGDTVPASAGGGEGVSDEKFHANFRSLVPGGFFSSDPDNPSVRRSVRTNNPGALNISRWQREFPGFVGVTDADSAGNVTTIYVTPEHGVGAWYHLLTQRYGYGETGRVVLKQLARKYSGKNSDEAPEVTAYIAGWQRWSAGSLDKDSSISLGDNNQVLQLARAMFGHEAGQRSPLHDDQVIEALRLKRANKLPAA